MSRLILAALMLSCTLSLVHAQDDGSMQNMQPMQPRPVGVPPVAPPAAPPAPPNVPSPPRIKPPDMRALRAEQRKQQRHMIEQMEKIDPKGAAKMKERLDNEEAIDEILSQYHRRSIEEAEARERLQPLVQSDADADAGRIDDRIQMLQAKIDYLKRAQGQPELLTRRRVDMLLGRDPGDARAFEDTPAPPKPPQPMTPVLPRR